MSAGADEPLGIPFSHELHFLMADRAAGVGAAGDGFPVSAFAVLADEHFSVFPVYFQHELPALGAFMPGQVVVPECSVRVLDLADQ